MKLFALAALALVIATPATAADVQRGRELFQQGCASCHGQDARGIAGRAPDLHGAGAAAADFYLWTGRMPLDEPQSQPERSEPAYDGRAIADLVAYVGSLGGPPVPAVPSGGNVAEGRELFTQDCATCHQVVARGGVVTGAHVPTLLESSPRDIAEAVRIGPYVMPKFSKQQLDDRQLASIIRYVDYAKHPENRGGWSLFDVGPVPEGMVAWLLGGLALVVVIRLLGERAE